MYLICIKIHTSSKIYNENETVAWNTKLPLKWKRHMHTLNSCFKKDNDPFMSVWEMKPKPPSTPSTVAGTDDQYSAALP